MDLKVPQNNLLLTIQHQPLTKNTDQFGLYAGGQKLLCSIFKSLKVLKANATLFGFSQNVQNVNFGRLKKVCKLVFMLLFTFSSTLGANECPTKFSISSIALKGGLVPFKSEWKGRIGCWESFGFSSTSWLWLARNSRAAFRTNKSSGFSVLKLSLLSDC